jgi:cytochrome d ubiquinol oxidase subunit I
MIGFGMAMILLALVGAFLWKKGALSNSRIFLKLLLPAISFPFLANTFGWVMTEVGRQPWTVFGLMTTSDAVSPNVPAGTILFSIIMYVLVFTILAVVMVYLIVREIKKGPEIDHNANIVVSTDPFNKVGA